MIAYYSKEFDQLSTYIVDTHGEGYFPEQPCYDPETNKKQARVLLVWNSSEVEDLIVACGKPRQETRPSQILKLPGLDALEELEAKIFPKLTEEYGASGGVGYVWHVSGTLPEVRRYFEHVAAIIAEGPKGADDDTYDYWPGGCDSLWQLATDLDNVPGLRKTRNYREQAAKAIKEALDNLLQEGQENETHNNNEYFSIPKGF